MAHKLIVHAGGRKFTERKGLEGPFQYVNGQVLYYDPKEGQYWDPLTDFYMEQEQMDALHAMTWSQLA
jgi:hypothetical protein